MAVKVYAKGSRQWLSKNFQAYEFDCSCPECKTTLIDTELVELLQDERDHFGRPVRISSGYRCPAHNKATPNASKTSLHTDGKAADHYIIGAAPAEQARYLESKGVRGIGLYETDADGWFVHADTRRDKSYWYGQAQTYRSTFGGTAASEVPEVEKPIAPSSGDEYTVERFTADVQRILGTNAKGRALLALTPTLSTTMNRTHPLVTVVQKRLLALGYDLGSTGPNKDGVDGIYGWTMKNGCVVPYQAANGCCADGVITGGRQTWECLLGL